MTLVTLCIVGLSTFNPSPFEDATTQARDALGKEMLRADDVISLVPCQEASVVIELDTPEVVRTDVTSNELDIYSRRGYREVTTQEDQTILTATLRVPAQNYETKMTGRDSHGFFDRLIPAAQKLREAIEDWVKDNQEALLKVQQ